MKKRVLTILLALTLLCSIGGTALASSGVTEAELTYRGITVQLDGATLVPADESGNGVEPFIMGGTTYLPLRAIAGALGLAVDWDGATSTVILKSGGEAGKGSGTPLKSSRTVRAELNYRDIKITLDGAALVPKDSSGAVAEPFIMGGTTYLPLRAIAGALGLEVGWDNATSTVSLKSSGQGSVDQTASAMTAYRAIVGQADCYFPDDEDYGGPGAVKSYTYALVQMQPQYPIPALLLSQQTDSYYVGSICSVLVFQYNPNSQTAIQAEGMMNQGVASAGGYRGILSAAADGNGVLETSWSSGTGEGWTDRVTVNGDSLSRVTVWSGMVFDDTNGVASVDIDWHELTDLSGLNG